MWSKQPPPIIRSHTLVPMKYSGAYLCGHLYKAVRQLPLPSLLPPPPSLSPLPPSLPPSLLPSLNNTKPLCVRWLHALRKHGHFMLNKYFYTTNNKTTHVATLTVK